VLSLEDMIADLQHWQSSEYQQLIAENAGWTASFWQGSHCRHLGRTVLDSANRNKQHETRSGQMKQKQHLSRLPALAGSRAAGVRTGGRDAHDPPRALAAGSGFIEAC